MTAIGQVAGVEDRRRMRMAQLGHRSRFAEKTVGNISIGRELTSDNFDGDWSLESEMGGKVDSSHAAGPDFAFYSESTSDKLGDIHADLPSGLKGRNASVLDLGWGRRPSSVAH